MAPTFPRRCATCGGEFEATREAARFCQRVCQRFERRCDDCGKTFIARSAAGRRCEECKKRPRADAKSLGHAFAPVKRAPGGNRAKKAAQELRQHRRADIDLALRERANSVVSSYRERTA